MLWEVCDVQRAIEAAVADVCRWVAVASITAPQCPDPSFLFGSWCQSLERFSLLRY